MSVQRLEEVMDAHGPVCNVLRIADLTADALHVASVHHDSGQMAHVVIPYLTKEILDRPPWSMMIIGPCFSMNIRSGTKSAYCGRSFRLPQYTSTKIGSPEPTN